MTEGSRSVEVRPPPKFQLNPLAFTELLVNCTAWPTATSVRATENIASVISMVSGTADWVSIPVPMPVSVTV